MTAETWDALLAMTAASSALAAALLLARLPLRKGFGARIAYLAWLVMPFAMLALLLPAPVAPPMTLAVGEAALLASTGLPDVPIAAFDQRLVGLLLWLAGVVITAALFIVRQLRFSQRLARSCDRNNSRDDILRVSSEASGPATVGFWRPRIVLPDDFEARWSPVERELILAHEQVHLDRGDTRVNALMAFVRALNWFNPLVHYAAGRMRIDQELACDAVVLARFPRARRHYAEAMVKSHLADISQVLPTPPAACHWPGGSTLKERIVMFKKPLPSRALHRAGVFAILLLASGAGCIAWASQSPQPVASTPAVADPGSKGQRPAGYARLSPPERRFDASGKPLDGTVHLRVRVGTDGRPLKVERVDVVAPALTTASAEQLVSAAESAVSTWVFEPAQRDGKSVESEVIVPLTFGVSRGHGSLPTDGVGADVLDEIVVGGD